MSADRFRLFIAVVVLLALLVLAIFWVVKQLDRSDHVKECMGGYETLREGCEARAKKAFP